MFETCIHCFRSYMTSGSNIGLGAIFEVQFKKFNFIFYKILLVCRFVLAGFNLAFQFI